MPAVQGCRDLFNRVRGDFSWLYKRLRGEVDSDYMISLRKSEHLCIDKLKELQWKKVKLLIEHAFDSVPFYRQQMNELGVHPSDICTLDDFKKLPLLTKRDLREREKDLISSKYSLASLRASQTGGSTGEPVKVYMDQRRIRLATTDEIWADGLSGWKIGEPIARLWGAPEIGRVVSKPRRLFRRYLLNPGYMIEAYDLDRETFLSFVDNYCKWHPTLIVGYASSLRELSQFLLAEGLKLVSPKAVISTAELLDEHTRCLIEEAFRCPVIDRYGSREMGLIACQCVKGEKYHVNMNRVYLEVIPDNDETHLHKSGKIVVTDLGNFGMPLIRYEIGDRAQLSENHDCMCGIQSDCLDYLEGRIFDFLVTADGKKIHGLTFNRYIFQISGVSQYRLVQESRGLVRIQVIENQPIAAEQIDQLKVLIREKIGGNTKVEFEKVNSLPKTPSGKHRYIECHVLPDDPL